MVDLSRREADLALRFVRPSQHELVVRRVGAVPFGLYASVRYLRDRPEAAAGAPADLIGLHESMDESPESRWLRAQHPGARVRVRVRSTLAVQAAILAGDGLLTHAFQVLGQLKDVEPARRARLPGPGTRSGGESPRA